MKPFVRHVLAAAGPLVLLAAQPLGAQDVRHILNKTKVEYVIKLVSPHGDNGRIEVKGTAAALADANASYALKPGSDTTLLFWPEGKGFERDLTVAASGGGTDTATFHVGWDAGHPAMQVKKGHGYENVPAKKSSLTISSPKASDPTKIKLEKVTDSADQTIIDIE